MLPIDRIVLTSAFSIGLVKKVSRLIDKASDWAEKNPDKIKAVTAMLMRIGMRAAMASGR
jgi:hypothetical protein